MKIVTVIGARPQFVKAAPLSLAFSNTNGIEEATIHTGQHFDENMSGIFFRELGLPQPAYNLDIHGGGHGQMTGRMLEAIEKILLVEKPHAVLVYGDTNSTLAGGLAAAKLHIPVIHVEAGLRSFNRAMPEEINRVTVDHLSDLLFCPTSTSVQNLEREGIVKGVHQVGDLMFDATAALTPIAERHSNILAELPFSKGSYTVATIHRADNTDSAETLEAAISYTLDKADGLPVVLPLHPRTKAVAAQFNLLLERPGLHVIDPLGYFDMLVLSKNAAQIFTDSGGLQKEAYFHGVPCVTLRSETEWVETIDAGWNRLWTVADYASRRPIEEYGDGHAAREIVRIINERANMLR